MNYKDLNNKLHIVDPEFAYLLPDGCIEISEQEAQALLPKPVPPTPLQEIRAIESKPEVADAFVRATRQLLLSTWFERARAKPGAAFLTVDQIEAWCRANDKTYKALAEAEDLIKPLRNKP